MDKEQETLDMVLDIPNTISLNPFDRPPNIMDDDLNSVTQEELEANLSTDCPTTGPPEIIETNTHQNANDMWEQLIQSVLEDTSTQDAVQQNEDCEIKEKLLQDTERGGLNEHCAEKEIFEDNKKVEVVVKNNVNTDKDDNPMDWDNSVQSNEICHTDKLESSYIKDEKIIMEYSLEEEQILSQHVTDNYYLDGLNNDDAQDDICQVEVYASNQDDIKDKNHIKEDMADNVDEFLEDRLSEGSSISLGDLTKLDNEHEEDCITQNDKVSHLFTINSDHCYSQEIHSKLHESDVLKQNVIHHLIAQKPNNDYKKITKLVDRIFNDLDNEKLNKILDSLNLNETTEIPLTIPENQIESLVNTTDCVQNNVDHNHENDIPNNEPFITGTSSDENQTEATETENKKVGENQQIDLSYEQHKEIKFENLINSHTNVEEQECTTNRILKEEEFISSKPSSNENDSNYQTTLIAEPEPMDNKLIVDSLLDNCSEPIEHNLFEEEFEELCQKGVLPIAKVKTKTDLSLNLLEKLKDFVSHVQQDCSAFTKASTNIDEKLHNYIKQQYIQYHDLFKPYCYTTNKQTVETQTDFKKLTKRKCRTPNKDSRNNLLNNSGHSKIYSSTSDEEDDAIFNKSPNKEIINNPLKNQQQDILDESKTLPSETKSLSLPPCSTNPPIINYSQEYDDGINLSQYVQSEIFDVDSTSQQSLIPSDDSDSLKEDDDDDDDDIPVNGSHQNSSFEEDKDEESDDTILFKIRPKKSKKGDSFSESKKTRKSQGGTENMSVNSESDKENLTSDRKDKKSNDSLDEDEKNDKEIERLTNISGLAKRPVCNASSTKSSDKNKPKVAASKNLNDRFDFMDVEFGSDDEVKSDAEEEIITEKQFLERCNEDIKRQMLDDSSTDSDAIDEDDDELLKASSEEDEEGGSKSPLVEKFLKTYVVDDSDNDIDDDNDDDEDAELDSDKDDEGSASNKETKTENVVALDEKDKTVDMLEDGEETPTAAELELLDANFRYRNRSTKNPKLEKMLSDVEKRKNISKIDAELISLSSDTENSDIEAIDVEPSQSTKPRALKPMLRNDQLAGETIKAQKNENERISRLEKKHNLLQKVLKEHPDLDKNKELILDYIKDSKTFIKVHPGIVKHLKPHQFDGVRFMYDSCYGGVDSLKKSPGSGCILAHCMGLGKTLQLIALLHTVISYKELKTTKILVLCPKSTVMNWADEIIRWLGPLRQKNVKVYTFSDTSDINEKLSILREWSSSSNTRAGCLLIGYEAFRTLVFYHSYKNRGNIDSQRLEEIRKNIDSYLLQPGADLVVCDEGHIIKNSKSAISMAVAKIVTPRRIVLTGTPIQNNLKEYYSMVNFIKPLFLGTEKEFANLYANPIKNGQHKDSGKTDIKIMKQRSFVLHKKLSKFVQRKEAELLKTFLPTKYEYVLFVPMTDVQNNLYQYILNAIANRDENYRGKGLITDYTCLRKIWTHPKVLEDAWKNAINQRNKKEHRKLLSHNSDDDEPDDIYDSQTGQMSVTNDWWRHLVKENDLESVMPSNKLRTMLKILQMCEEMGEKCLIFSAFVAVLNVVEYFFKKINEGDPTLLTELSLNSNSKWILGQDYYRLDGKTQKTIRHAMINEFNSIRNKRARVFLISAKAGGQGINLIGANRVIILDTSWNPSNDQQNIFRVFRLGQTRCCYIYRLLAMGTMEEKVYSRSVTKQAMSFRVVDEQQIDRHYNMAELAELYALTIPDHANRPTPIRPQDNILARLLRSFPDLVFKYHEHDSLLENKVEQELSEQEKNEAWTAYERDLQMSSEIREMPNMEDLHNKFNANLPNYLSPFSGLDVSNSNNQNPNSNKNMSPLYNYRGFGPPFLQSLLGQNNNATTQQYIEMFNYYKNLGSSYADLNPYSQMPGIGGGGGGRMPTAATASTVPPNPLTALGDLSMYGLGSSALQSLGASAAALNMPSSLSSSSAALQHLTNSASMYTSSPSAMQTNLPTTSASSLAAGGLTSASNSPAALSAFEQYTQSLRGSFPSMYNYTGDFGLSSSGSTILDKSKGKNSKQGNSNNKNTNLPGGSKGGSVLGLYPGPPAYLPQQQPPQQQSIPNSRNTPSAAEQSHKGKSSSTTSSSTSNNSMMSANSGRSTNNNDLINYRRSDSTGAGSNSSSVTQQKKNDGDNSNHPKHNFTQNPKSMKSPTNVSTPPVLHANQKVNQKSSLNLSSNASSGSSKASLQAEARSLNMGILYPNSKGIDKSSNKPNSPLNMGIVYPKSSNKSSSEMQIIPTSSPPGTTSISKQLNDLPPSISLTALKNNAPNNKQTQNITSKTNTTTTAQNIQINKLIQSNNTTVRRTSPVQSTPTNGTKISANLNSTNVNGNSTASQNSILARYKTLNNNNNKKPPANNNNPIPPLHRSSTIATMSTSNATPKTPAGLTITNVKTPMKPQNITTAKQIAAAQQVTTLAKQTAAAAVAKSNVQRLSTPNTPNSSTNTLQKPSAGQIQTTTPLPSLTSIKRVINRASPIQNTNKLPPSLSSPSSSLTVTASTKVPIISSVKSISQSPTTMATITKASISKTNPSNSSMIVTKSTTSASGQNLPIVTNVSKALAQMQKNLPASASSSTAASNIANAARSTVNIRPVDNKQNPAGSGGVYIIETNINDKKLAIGTPTKSGGGTTVTKVPIQTAIKRKATDHVSKDIESKRLKK